MLPVLSAPQSFVARAAPGARNSAAAKASAPERIPTFSVPIASFSTISRATRRHDNPPPPPRQEEKTRCRLFQLTRLPYRKKRVGKRHAVELRDSREDPFAASRRPAWRTTPKRGGFRRNTVPAFRPSTATRLPNREQGACDSRLLPEATRRSAPKTAAALPAESRHPRENGRQVPFAVIEVTGGGLCASRR